MGWTDAVSDRMARLLASASRRGKCESPPEEVRRGGFPAKVRQSDPVVYDESVDGTSSFAATSFTTTTTASTTSRRGAPGGSAAFAGTGSNSSTLDNSTIGTSRSSPEFRTTLNTGSSSSSSGGVDTTSTTFASEADSGLSPALLSSLLDPEGPSSGAGESGSNSGLGVPVGLGAGSGLGTPGRRTPTKAARGADDSAQISAATAAAVAAAAAAVTDSGLGRVGKMPPRVPSTLSVDEEFEGPDTSSLAAFLLSLLSVNPRGNKAGSDTCSLSSGDSYLESDGEEGDEGDEGEEGEEEEYEEGLQEDGYGRVEADMVGHTLGVGQDGRVRRRGRAAGGGGLGVESGGEEGGGIQERKGGAGEGGKGKGGGTGGGGGGGAKRGWLPPFISRFAAGPGGNRTRDSSSPSITPSSSSSSLSADAGCGDVALTSAARLEVREDNGGANQQSVQLSASLSAQLLSATVSGASASGAAISAAASGAAASGADMSGAAEPLHQRSSEPVTTANYSQALNYRASEPASGNFGPRSGRERITSPNRSGRDGVLSPNARRDGVLSPNSLDVSPGLSPRLPDMMDESFLLSDTCRSVICQSLPAIASGREWVLLYSTFKHGISLQTLYRRSSMMPGPCLLVVTEQDSNVVFGGFSSHALVASNRRKYQGSSEVFVFTDISGQPMVYKATGANRYFVLCLNEALSFGGGGHFALCLQEDLLTGSSGACETFRSPCLSKSEDFKIKHVELWGFAHQSRYAPTKANWHEPSQPQGFHANW